MIDPIEKPMTSRHPRPARWTVGRVLKDLAIIVVAVRLLFIVIVPEDRLPSIPRCGTTEENGVCLLALIFLALHPAYKILKSINDRLDRYLPNHCPEPKPSPLPLDDF